MNMMYSNLDLEPEPLKDSNSMDVVKFLEEENVGERKSKEVFTPDDWSVAILSAVLQIISKKYNQKGKKISVLEVGIGSGINLKFLLKYCKDKINKIYGTDLIQEAIDDSTKCIDGLNDDGTCKLMLSNLLQSVPKKVLDTLDFKYACIPQVILPKGSVRPDDFYAHYYEEEEFKHFIYNKFGFGLLEKDIYESCVKAPGLDIVLNVSGRISKSIINSMFESYGYSVEYVYDKIIPQCPETELGMYVELEKENKYSVGEFYEDAEGKKVITAELAEKRRRDNLPVFHRLYVVKGSPKDKFKK